MNFIVSTSDSLSVEYGVRMINRVDKVGCTITNICRIRKTDNPRLCSLVHCIVTHQHIILWKSWRRSGNKPDRFAPRRITASDDYAECGMVTSAKIYSMRVVGATEEYSP